MRLYLCIRGVRLLLLLDLMLVSYNNSSSDVTERSNAWNTF